MNPDLEALVKAFEAYAEAGVEDSERHYAIYNALLEETAQRTVASKESIHRSVRFCYGAWIKAHKRPSSLPPNA